SAVATRPVRRRPAKSSAGPSSVARPERAARAPVHSDRRLLSGLTAPGAGRPPGTPEGCQSSDPLEPGAVVLRRPAPALRGLVACEQRPARAGAALGG